MKQLILCVTIAIFAITDGKSQIGALETVAEEDSLFKKAYSLPAII